MKLKFGIVGAGGRGIECFGNNLSKRPDTELTALCDTNMVRMKVGSEKISGQQNFYISLEEMLDKENLDGVIITSPDYCHEKHAITVLKGGIDVLIDKPLATTVDACKNIIATAKHEGKSALIGFNLRHAPVLQKLKRIIDSGTLGNIILMENREFYPDGRTYMSRWNSKYENCGGLWVHKGSHDFDVFNWLLNFPKPIKVSSVAGINVLTPEHLPFELEDGIEAGPDCMHCAYKLRCPDRYNVESQPEWGEEARKNDNYLRDACMYLSDKNVHDNGISIVEYENGVRISHMECFITSHHDRLYTIIGDKGQAEVSFANRTILVRPRWSKETIFHQLPKLKGGHGGADPKLVEQFVNVIKGDKVNTSTLEHGMLSTAIGQAAELSWREDRTVFINELLK